MTTRIGRATDSDTYQRLRSWMTRIKNDGNRKVSELKQSSESHNSNTKTSKNNGINNKITSMIGELEVRLGKFENRRYIGGLDIENWNSLAAIFYQNFYKCETSMRVYYAGNLYIEQHVDINNKWFGIEATGISENDKENIIMDKVAVGRRDFTELGMRAAFKIEVGRQSHIQNLKHVIKERHRERRIYRLGDYYELHLTKVVSFVTGRNKNKLDVRTIGYEAELELREHIDLLGASDDVLDLLTGELLRHLNIIENIGEIQKEVTVNIPYNKLGIKRNGLMNKPGDLGVTDLPQIVRRYTATDKADGERRFLIITNNGRGVMVTSRGAIEPISRIGESSNIRSDKDNNSTLGSIFDGMLDYLDNIFSDSKGNSVSSKYLNEKNYLDDVMPQGLFDDEWYGAIFDCEYLIDSGGRKRLYVFDCIGCGNNNKTYRKELIVRLACVDRFCRLFSSKEGSGQGNGLSVNITAKKFYVEKEHLTNNELATVRYLDNVIVTNKFSTAVCKLWTERKTRFWYELDGIIMTPLDGPYLVSGDNSNSSALGKPMKIYKWKDEQTIDVKVYRSKKSGSSKWMFYTGCGSKEHLIDEAGEYYFDSRRGIGEKGKRNIADNIKNGQIIEMIWDSKAKQFVPYRDRTGDKECPNSQLTISSIIKLVRRPVLIEDLVRYLAEADDGGNDNIGNIVSDSYRRNKRRGNGSNKNNKRSASKEFGKLYYQEVEQLSTRRRALDINMRNFHNWVKAELIGHISDVNGDGRKMLLDLSVGKGGDMRKWLKAGIDVVVGIDISGTAIEEARRRYKEQLTADEKRQIDMYFINGDSTRLIDLDGNMALDNVSKQEWRRFCAKYGVHDTNNKALQIFDMVVSNFAIHYILETSEQRKMLCQNLEKCLAPNGGLFVGTLLDADIVRDELSRAASKNRGKQILEAETDNGEVFYRIESANSNSGGSSDSDSNSSDGKKVKKIIVSRTGWANPIPEPAISATKLCNILKKCSGIEWSKLQLDTFKRLYGKRKKGAALSDGERYISFMHKTFIGIRK